MYQELRDVVLKSGECAKLGVVTSPDHSEIASEVKSLLGHKGRSWRWQIEQSLTEDAARSTSRFYVLGRDKRLVSGVMLAECRGIGTIAHVFTLPGQRRKGAAELLTRFAMGDFRGRGGQALYLSTDFDTPQYHLYARLGFHGIEPGRGSMSWHLRDAAAMETRLFAQSSVRYEALGLGHWPALSALTTIGHAARLRIAGMDVLGPSTSEGGSLPVLIAMGGGPTNRKDRGARAFVAVSDASGVPVGIACVRPDPTLWERVDIADLFCAPGFEEHLKPLHERLEITGERTTVCYVDRFWSAKADALRSCGFLPSHTVPHGLNVTGHAHDLDVWIRNPGPSP